MLKTGDVIEIESGDMFRITYDESGKVILVKFNIDIDSLYQVGGEHRRLTVREVSRAVGSHHWKLVGDDSHLERFEAGVVISINSHDDVWFDYELVHVAKDEYLLVCADRDTATPKYWCARTQIKGRIVGVINEVELDNLVQVLRRHDWQVGKPDKTQTALDVQEGGNHLNAHKILEKAAQHMKDRAATYDKPEGERSMGATVEAFKAITGHELTEEQGWLFMALLKAVRSQQGGYRADSYEDGAAYFALAGEAAAGTRTNEN